MPDPLQAPKAPPSSLHWKSPDDSVFVNVKVALVELVVEPPAGPPVIDVSGGVVSPTVTVWVAKAAASLPTTS